MGMGPRAGSPWRCGCRSGCRSSRRGLRVATVQSIGLVTLGGLVGAGGLGALVFEGLAQFAPDLILLGALPVVALAVVADVGVAAARPGPGDAAVIAFEGVSVAFGETAALNGIDLRVEAGDLCVLVGPSGSGKSTLLRLVNRLIRPSAGRVACPRARTSPGSTRRRCAAPSATSSSRSGCFPHRTVARNIATVPRLLGWPKRRIAERIEAMLALVRLDEPGIAGALPAGLSGGQAQRVGLARALAADPDLLLMDEPFGAVDPITRRSLRAELRRIHAETGKTVVLVTHDPGEALELATRLVVMRDGRVAAAGRPDDLYGPAATRSCASFSAATSSCAVSTFSGSRRWRALGRRRTVRRPAVAIPAERTLREALDPDAGGALVRSRRRRDAAGGPVGSISLADLAERSP